jgi:uncharacterized protein YdaU (DUF1376 family)
MAELPMMPLWVRDYLADTTHLSCAQKGIYSTLLFVMWAKGGYIDNDERSLARLVNLPLIRFRDLFPEVSKMLMIEGDRITQKRLLLEYEKARTLVEKKSRAGRASVEAKALKKQDQASTPVPAQDKHTFNKPEAEPDPDTSSENPSGSSSPPPEGRAKRRAEARGTRLTDDWRPSSDDVQYARDINLPDQTIRVEVEKFKNYWLAKSGSSAVKLDWSRTWKNWVLSAKERMPKRPDPTIGGRPRI